MDLKFINKKNFDKYDPDLKTRIQPKVLSYNTDSSKTSWPKLAAMPVCMVLAVSIFAVGVVVLSNRSSVPESPDYLSPSETIMRTEAEITYTESNTEASFINETPSLVIPTDPPTTYVPDADFKDVLSSYGTSINSTSSARITNIIIGTETINGTILMPGEAFSFNGRVGDTTPDKGYQKGASYLDGETVQTYGGGICQVSTTLYNAVIRAGLEILERSCHAMSVGYIDKGMDAAVAYGAKDLLFKNNLSVPIKITGEVSDSNITFKICGVNNNKDTNYKFASKKVDQTVENGKTYHIYESYRTVMVNGKVVEDSIPFAKSYYIIK